MLKNYIKIALRSLLKNKTSSAVNIFGLTIGLTCCLLISLYVQDELSYDRFQDNGKKIARVIMEYSFGSNKETTKGNFTSTKVAPVFKRTFPEVSASLRMSDATMIVKKGENLISEPHFVFADSSFFEVFGVNLLKGNTSKALDGPNKVVLTESSAKKYFGDQDPLGKILLAGSDTTAYEVTGVVKDYPSNSQLRFDFLASFSSLGENQEKTYFNANYTTYLLLKDESSFASLQPKIHTFMKKEMEGSGAAITFFLEPFRDVHLYSDYEGFTTNTNIKYLYILSAIALLILAIVCFTYINLSTARSMERAREVGVRKVIGAEGNQLFWQFIGESTISCLISIVLSLGVAAVTLPYFNQLANKTLHVQALVSPYSLLFFVLLTILVSILSGSYPALILSRFQPVKVLKGSFRNTGTGKLVQSSLIVFQFGISLFLIVSTLVIQKQVQFIQNKKLGYNREHILVLPINQKVVDNIAAIKQEFKSSPDIIRVSRCASTPVSIASGYVMRSATMPENEQIGVTANPVDEDYLKTTGLQLIAGEDFTEQDAKDVVPEKQEDRRYHFILNESAAKKLGWSARQAVGQKLFLDSGRPGIIKGVVKDFHFETMHYSIKPLVLFTENWGSRMLVKIDGANTAKSISILEEKWKSMVPYLPFEYSFLDQEYAKLYKSEMQLSKVMTLFTSLSLVLACLGLFGLSSYVVQQRSKEIGVRKVLGASVSGIVFLLSGSFVRLIGIAFLLSVPVAWWAMSSWLTDFQYKIDISWTVFLIAGISVLIVTLVTIGLQSIKAALVNPVNVLKSE